MWTKHFNGTGQNQPTSVIMDDNGNYYIYGNFNGTVSQDAISYSSFGGSQDIFLSKYNSLGEVQWIKQIGGTGVETAVSLLLSADGSSLILSGQTNGTCDFGGTSVTTVGLNDIFLAKFSLSGNCQWAKNVAYGATHQINGAIAEDNSGSIVMTGIFIDAVTFYGGSGSLSSSYSGLRQMFIAKFDSGGNFTWSKLVGCSDAANSSNIKSVTSYNGEYYFTGSYVGNLDINGTAISNSTGFTDGVLFKMNSSGTVQWVKQITGNDNAEIVYRHTMDESGNLYLTGHFISSTVNLDGTILTNTSAGTYDVFIAKYNTNGSVQWAQSAGSTADDKCLDITFKNGKGVVTGSFGGAITFGTSTLSWTALIDAFIAEFNTSGNFTSGIGISGGANDTGEACFYNSNGRNYITAGDFYSASVTIGSTTLTNSTTDNSKRDAYIMKYGCFDDVNLTVTPVSCVDDLGIPIENDGAITATPTTGSEPYTYLWSNGATTATASGLGLGNFSVTITGAYGCSLTATATVTNLPALQAAITSSSNVLCNGGANGPATVTASLGVAPYNYTWSNGAATSTATGLTAGAYTVTVSDQCGNMVIKSVTITQPTAVSVFKTLTNPTCYGYSNGIVNLTVTGGTSPYSFLWSNGATSEDITGIPAGTYNVTITDGAGCTTSSSSVLAQPVQLVATITSQTNVTCNGGSNGTATVTASGGSAPYTYLWNDPAPAQTTSTATALTAGTWTVTVTSLGGCTASASAIITQPVAMTAWISSQTNVTCFGFDNGTATVSYSGGTGSVSYLWNDPAPVQTAATASNLGPGNYSVTVTRTSGCAIANVTITEPADLILNIQTVQCDNGSCNGIATQVVTGGTTPYSYQWKLGSFSYNTQTLSGMCSGSNYRAIVTDANGCPKERSKIKIPSCGIPALSASSLEFTVFPNPAKNMISIIIDDDDFIGNPENIKLELINQMGQLVSVEEKEIVVGVEFNKDLSDLPPGIYLIAITTKNERVTKRLIVQ